MDDKTKEELKEYVEHYKEMYQAQEQLNEAYKEVVQAVPGQCPRHGTDCPGHAKDWIQDRVDAREEIIQKSQDHEVQLEAAGQNRHYYKVNNKYGNEHEISIAVTCTCEYCSIQGQTSKKDRCSYVIAVLRDIIDTGSLNVYKARKDHTKQARRNDAMQLLKRNSKPGEVKISKGESPEHGAFKQAIVREEARRGKACVTEAEFKTGGRADVFILDDFNAIEIMQTEDDKSIEGKLDRYPDTVKLTKVKLP